MGKNLIETVMGSVVLLVAGMFLIFAYTHADLAEVRGYFLNAKFTSAGGLHNGSDVRINGIKVGTVTAQTLDTDDYMARIRMSIADNIRLPEDSEVSIISDGLLGGSYVRIQPGHSDKKIPDDGWFSNTKPYRALEEMVGDIIFSVTSKGDSNQGSAAPSGGGSGSSLSVAP